MDILAFPLDLYLVHPKQSPSDCLFYTCHHSLLQERIHHDTSQDPFQGIDGHSFPKGI